MFDYGSNNTNKLSPQERISKIYRIIIRSNNTNKLSPQEPNVYSSLFKVCSNNTNKLSPQERFKKKRKSCKSSNNTNKLSPQEQEVSLSFLEIVQIIQINLALKNPASLFTTSAMFK